MLTADVQERTAQLTKANNQLNNLTREIFNAQENERRRIALKLHDGVGQSLTAIKYFIEELIKTGSDSADNSHTTKLRHVVDKVKDTVEEVRNISMDLRPSILDDLGIGATTSWHFREFEKMHATINVDLDVDIDEDKISGLLATTIYRITQEATNNIVKHANSFSAPLH